MKTRTIVNIIASILTAFVVRWWFGVFESPIPQWVEYFDRPALIISATVSVYWSLVIAEMIDNDSNSGPLSY